MTRLYLAGPMRGHEDLNFPAFHQAAYSLRRNGFDVFNPAETGVDDIRGCLAVDTAYITGMAEGIALLPGHEASLGARAEVALAHAIGIPARPVTAWLRPRRIVGLSGYAQAGKDTVGELLGDAGWAACSFAAALKDAALTLNPRVRLDGLGFVSTTTGLADLVRRVGWDTAKTHFVDVRPFLQRLGTDFGRAVLGDDIWVDIAFRTMPLDVPVVFTDVRFPNEARAIAAAGGEVWRIDRPGCVPANTHPSETALDDWPFDRRLDNSGTIADLRDRVLDALKELTPA